MNPNYCRTGSTFLSDTQATAVFHLENGSTLTFDNVNVDSIGPSAESRGVIGVEFEDNSDRIVHIPFVRYWEIIWN